MAEFSAPRRPTGARHAPREYSADAAIVFWKTDDPFGGLSNMAKGYPVRVGDREIRSVEALYQALRFPSHPALQLEVLEAGNAWLAKRLARAQSAKTRGDWHRVRVSVMRWCLRLKLGHSRQGFGPLLLETGERPIVERSSRDQFWGAMMESPGRLVGANFLGRLLMELRAHIRRDVAATFESVAPPPGFKLMLLGEEVSSMTCTSRENATCALQLTLPASR